MQGLAGKIQIERGSFGTDLDGQIDMSGLMTVSNMSLSFLANTENLNDSINYAPSNDERSFSDFDIDGTEKDWRQDAMSQTNGSGLAYNNNDNKETVDTFMDGVEAMADMQEARQRSQQELYENFGYSDGTYKVNGKEFSEDELNDAIEKAKDDPEAFAKEYNIKEEDVPLAAAFMQDLKGAKTPEEIAAVYDGYPASVVEPVTSKMEENTKADLNQTTQFKADAIGIKSIDQSTNEARTAEEKVFDSGLDEWDSPAPEASSTSVAKSVSQEEPATSNLKDGFTQAAEQTVADANIPIQNITVEHQNIPTV